MSKHRVLITGITGFVGSHLAEYILTVSPQTEIIGLNRWRSSKENIKEFLDKLTLVNGDLTDSTSLYNVIRIFRPHIIYHLAAQSYVDYSFQAPRTTLETNIIGTLNLLEVVRMQKEVDGYNPIVHICSSSEVYGQVDEAHVPITEQSPLNPASPYAVGKVGEDMLALQYWLSWRIQTIRTRMFTHTGPRRGEVFVLSNFAKQVAAIEAKKQPPIVKVGNLNSIRTWMDVRDAVRAYWLLPTHCAPGEVYNIGGSTVLSVKDMLAQLLQFSDRNDISVVEDRTRLRPSDVTLQIPSSDKFKNVTGWEPKIPFSTTVLDTLNFWRDKYKEELL